MEDRLSSPALFRGLIDWQEYASTQLTVHMQFKLVLGHKVQSVPRGTDYSLVPIQTVLYGLVVCSVNCLTLQLLIV